METSQTLKEFGAAFAKAQGEMGNAPKNHINPFFKSKYADLCDILDTAKPVLMKHGFSLIQGVSSEGKTVIINTMLLHSSGEFIKDSLKLTSKDETPQSIGSTISYGRRYSAQALLGMGTDEDDDGNGASGKEKDDDEKKKQNQKTQPAAQKRECPPEILEVKQKIGSVLKKLGVKEDFFHGDIMKAQQLLGIQGKTENFKLEDWEKILYHFTNVLISKGKK